jgi:hypothetical protein
MERGRVLVLIQHVHRSVLRVYKLVIVLVLMKHLVEWYVVAMVFNFVIVQDTMIHIIAMVCILEKLTLFKKHKIYFE